MAEIVISVLTDCSKKLGTGHFQRMLNLVRFLNLQSGVKAFLVRNDNADIPDTLKKYIIGDVHSKSRIIIRDMRNSEVEEILSLKKISRVLVVDDCGSGRSAADFTVDLLPNLHSDFRIKNYTLDYFIYGFNFTTSIFDAKENLYDKTIDLAFYPGFGSGEKYIERIISYLPEGITTAVLSGRESYYIINGKKEKVIDKSYSEILLSSKCIITHFGITLFEAHLCGCRIFTINPTDYHNKITDRAGEFIKICNLGRFDKLDKNTAAPLIMRGVEDMRNIKVSGKDVHNTIQKRLLFFYHYILNLISR